MRKHFDFYGYNAPTCGRYYVNDVEYSLGEDYRSVKRYKEYKDIGFNMCLLQHDNSYKGEKWETSSAKKCLDICAKVGLRTILEDKRIKDISMEPIIVGEGGRFKTQEELDAFLIEATSIYIDHPALYAIQLQDEPAFKYLKNYAFMYKTFKRLFPKLELQCNLLNMVQPTWIAPDPEHLQTMHKDYEDYLRYFQKESGIDYLMTDEYAFRGNNVLSHWSIPTFQVLANVCRDLGVELRLVLQSFCQEGMVVNREHPELVEGSCHWRRITEKEMYWQMNLALGLGCKEFSYFTYFTKARKALRAQRAVSDGIDGGALVNLDGTRTKLWFATQKIIREFKEFEPVIINYNYDNSYLFFPEGTKKEDYYPTKEAVISDVSALPISVKATKCPILVSEMKNGDARMYMIQNVGNPIDETLYKKRIPQIEIDLGDLASKAKFYYKGKLIDKKAENGVVKEKLARGQAIFIEIK